MHSTYNTKIRVANTTRALPRAQASKTLSENVSFLNQPKEGFSVSLTNFAALTNEQKTVWSRDFWAAARNASFINKFAGWFSQNGNGEMTGTTWVKESGLLYGPVMITNTHSVGVVRDAVISWAVKHYDFDKGDWWSLPVVAEPGTDG